ncbi:MAG: hypothetical protein LBQ54_13350 [Planctomycetaceae bacterium]|jgi:hypothetical protein|nr:hypothetical protein [Planctomycetaceae bacterium]
MNRFVCFILFCAVLGMTAGCGSKNQKVSGKVTFTDGSPLTTGIVCFVAEDGSTGRGEIALDGTYVMGFESEKNGIPKGGTYQVSIINALKEEGTDKTGMPILKPLINRKYDNVKTSGLTFIADGKSKTFDITVEPAK